MPAAELRQLHPSLPPSPGRKYQKGGGSQMRLMPILSGNAFPSKHLPVGLRLTVEEVARHRHFGCTEQLPQSMLQPAASTLLSNSVDGTGDVVPVIRGSSLQGGSVVARQHTGSTSWFIWLRNVVLFLFCAGPYVSWQRALFHEQYSKGFCCISE